MKTSALIALIAALVLTGSASAHSRNQGFSLGGYHASSYMWQWAAQSQMPLPPVHIAISFGGPAEYGPHSVYLPSCCSGGWNRLAIQGLFYHELGHVYDAVDMTPTLRAEFRQAVGVPAGWNWMAPMKTIRWVVGPTYIIKIAPIEMFAEEYAACSLGMTQLQYQEAGYNTYGWVPPQGTNETALCNLMRQ